MDMVSSSAISTTGVSSLADEIIAEVFSFLGSVNTARCSYTNKQFYRIARNSRALWRRFVYDEFGLAQGSESADWYEVYRYIKLQQHAYFESLHDNFIPSRLVFCDDGSHQPGNDPQHALERSRACWCTNAFVDTDVDLVADLQQPHLVMALEITNGNAHYSAPVKEALAFGSLELPNLERARQFDGSKGIALAREISDQYPYPGKLPPDYPLAGFCFPGIPRAYSATQQKPALRPTVARYVHFKLLTSSKCRNRVSNNIDVCNLFAFGVPLPRLNEMIHQESQQVPPDPSQYTQNRKHKVREYPWHIHDEFQAEQMREWHHEQRLHRLSEMLEENRRHLHQLEHLVAVQFRNDAPPEQQFDSDIEEMEFIE